MFERDGVAVVVDDVSLDLLNGAEIDFVEDLMGASFQIKNPNAASSCGCGNSFSITDLSRHGRAWAGDARPLAALTATPMPDDAAILCAMVAFLSKIQQLA